MAQSQRKEAKRQKEMLDRINKVEKPILTSILIAFFWELFVIAMGIGFHYTKAHNSYINSFEIGFGVGLGIAILWVLVRFGVLEGPRLRYKNYRNKKMQTKLETRQSLKITLDEFRSLNKKRSWIGIYIMLGMNLVGTIITVSL